MPGLDAGLSRHMTAKDITSLLRLLRAAAAQVGAAINAALDASENIIAADLKEASAKL
jgi:hypothetical protein